MEQARPVTLAPETAAAMRDALQAGFESCGEDPDCIYAAPLSALNLAIALAAEELVQEAPADGA